MLPLRFRYLRKYFLYIQPINADLNLIACVSLRYDGMRFNAEISSAVGEMIRI